MLPPAPSNDSPHAWVFLSIAIGATAILGFMPQHMHIYTGDGLEQIELAQCLAEGGGLSCPGLGYWPPLFSLVTWAMWGLFDSIEAAARMVGIVAAGLVPALVYAVSRRLTPLVGLHYGRASGMLAAGFTFASPHFLFYGTMADNRPLYLLMVALTAALLIWLIASGRLVFAFLAGVAAALASLSRPEGKALILVALLVTAWALWRRRQRETPGAQRAISGIGLAALGATITYAPYLWLLNTLSEGSRLVARGWEMAVIHWAPLLPKELILSLMGFTVHGTPLRHRMVTEMAQETTSSLGLFDSVGQMTSLYVDQLPMVTGLALDAIPIWLLILSPIGAGLLTRKRDGSVLLLLGLLLAPYILFPALPQSTNDKVPSGNFLSALIPLSALTAAACAFLIDHLRLPIRGKLAMVLATVCITLASGWAISVTLNRDADLHLFEGHPLPRGAGLALAERLPEEGRIVTTYPGTAIAHFSRRQRTPMPSSWELSLAMEAWRDRPTLFVLVHPDLTDRGLLVQELMRYVPDPCRPVFHSRGTYHDWVFACEVGGPGG